MKAKNFRRLMLAALSAVALGSLASAQGEWTATYLQNPKKPEERTPLGDGAGLQDRHWLTVEYSDYAGFQPSLAMIVEPEKSREDRPRAQTEVGKIVEDIRWLTDHGDERGSANERYSPERITPTVLPIVRAALGKTNRFRVVDRGVAFQAALDEQDIGAGGRLNKRSAVRLGNLRGSSYGVKTTVIEVNPEKEVKNIQVGAGVLGTAGAALGGISVGGKVAYCRINVAVVDLETGDVIFDTMVDGTASEKTLDWGGAFVKLLKRPLGLPLPGALGTRSSSKESAVISDAIKACANKAAHHIATRMKDRPFQTSVARGDGPRLWIIGGSDVGIRPEMRLELLSRGEVVVDPVSGDTVDVATTRIGQVRVAEVREKTSVCEIVEGGTGVKPGDLVRYQMPKL